MSLDDTKTQNLPGYLPLVEGIPLMLTRSLFTELGLSNGTIGIFKQLIYVNDTDTETDKTSYIPKNRYPDDTVYIKKPVFILVEFNNTIKLPNMEGLPPRIVPIPLDEQDFYVDISKIFPSEIKKNNLTIPKLKVKRKQFPLIPSYAYTSHKSQGQTLTKSVVDLQFPPPPFGKEIASTYVPLTRVKKMEDLAFFRDFPLSSLSGPKR